MLQVIEKAGFRNPAVRDFFDSFSGTSKENVARKFGVKGANFIAYK
ncbi:MAG: hypothetical protein HY323_07480 [Betaproteobacteria bacterium]|nr:hypothetical protein [Betaproteobacteria bacterium]